MTVCASELGLSKAQFQALVAQGLGCQPDQVRGSLLTNADFLAVIEWLEEIHHPKQPEGSHHLQGAVL